MKKLMIAAAVAAMAVASQAAQFKWTTSADVCGVALASLSGNTTVSANGDAMKNASSLMAYLTIYSSDGTTKIGETSKTVGYGFSGSKASVSFVDITGTSLGTAYTYTLKITGTQNNMATYTDAEWDYSGATIETTYSGSITTEAQGKTTIATGAPTSWTVSGATPIPEPTSAMLLPLGFAGLALKRKQK